MCEMDETIGRKEYDEDVFPKTGVKVFLINDNETHHYAAKTMWEALKKHSEIYEEDNLHDSDVTVSLVDPGTILTRTEPDGIVEDFPATFERDADPQAFSRGVKVSATAAEWAYFYSKEAPYQIMSSVF